MTIGKHPKEHGKCPSCRAGVAVADWQPNRTLPQVGQTYECSNCEAEVYVYRAGEPSDAIRQWREVTDYMAMSLRVFAETGQYPDDAVEDLMLEGLDRTEAVDYHIVEREGLTQTEWAEKRGVDQSTVSQNILRAKDVLE